MLHLRSAPAPLHRAASAPVMAATGEAAAPAAAPRPAAWNPQGLTLPVLAIPEYCRAAPPYLDGSLAGDVGFDPLGLLALANPTREVAAYGSGAARAARMASMSPVERQQALVWMRTAELKHARLAMLCAAGWPLAELANGEALRAVGTNGRAPSLLNGGLADSPAGTFVALVFGGAAFVEAAGAYYGANGGDYGFDPLGVASGEGPVPRELPHVGDARRLALAELKNGRLAMLAVAGYVAQEVVRASPVVEQTPWLFGR
jgi:light-harvesting complex II chlorophyll a/b binding protein 4